MLKQILSLFDRSHSSSHEFEDTYAHAFSNPELLFRYINAHLLNADFESENTLHIQKIRTKFVIPSHCASQYVKERELILIAGVLFYVKRAFPNQFYLTLRGYFVDAMFNERARNDSMLDRDEVDQVLSYYEDEEDPYNCTEFFLARVFGGLAIVDELRGSELILNVSFNYILSTSEIIHEDHRRALSTSSQK
jgi:hypothetical protein